MTEVDKKQLIKELNEMQEKLHFYNIMINDMDKRIGMIISGLKKDASFKNMPDHLDSPGPKGPKGIAAPPGLQLLIDREEGNIFDKKNFTVEYHG